MTILIIVITVVIAAAIIIVIVTIVITKFVTSVPRIPWWHLPVLVFLCWHTISFRLSVPWQVHSVIHIWPSLPVHSCSVSSCLIQNTYMTWLCTGPDKVDEDNNDKDEVFVDEIDVFESSFLDEVFVFFTSLVVSLSNFVAVRTRKSKKLNINVII